MSKCQNIFRLPSEQSVLKGNSLLPGSKFFPFREDPILEAGS